MDYRYLPPGLNRRLTYSYRIRNIRNITNINTETHLNIRNYLDEIPFTDVTNITNITDITDITDVTYLTDQFRESYIEEPPQRRRRNEDTVIDEPRRIRRRIFQIEPPGLEHFRGQFNITDYSNIELPEMSDDSDIDDESNFTNLIDIQKGIISKELYQSSNVKISEKSDRCTICLEMITKEKDIIRNLKCKHFFHINCIDYWFTENKTCPNCRAELKLS